MSGLLFLSSQPQYLISGGGDGSLRLWQWQVGKQIDAYQFENAQLSTVKIGLKCSARHLVLNLLKFWPKIPKDISDQSEI